MLLLLMLIEVYMRLAHPETKQVLVFGFLPHIPAARLLVNVNQCHYKHSPCVCVCVRELYVVNLYRLFLYNMSCWCLDMFYLKPPLIDFLHCVAAKMAT